MDDELQEELDEGREAARALAQHLQAMSAAQATITIDLDGERYEVQAIRKGYIDDLI